MNIEEQQKLLTELIYANEQLKNNIKQLQDLQNINSVLSKLEEFQNIDVDFIKNSINQIDFNRAGIDIFKGVNQNIQNQILNLDKNVAIVKQKNEDFEVAIDGLSQITEMSSEIQNISKYIKNYKTKTVLGISSLALLFGLFSGVFVSNFKDYLVSNEFINFAQKYDAKIIKDGQNQYLEFPQNTNIKI
ncbi:MAG: hypothetical protein U9Q83_01740, partial [Bacteroidota bacterium]|nr:hypothetical protein [Bacteroidota bacterium]